MAYLQNGFFSAKYYLRDTELYIGTQYQSSYSYFLIDPPIVLDSFWKMLTKKTSFYAFTNLVYFARILHMLHDADKFLSRYACCRYIVRSISVN